MNCLSPSLLASDFSILGEQVKMLDEAGAQYVHIDVRTEFCAEYFFRTSGDQIHPQMYGSYF